MSTLDTSPDTSPVAPEVRLFLARVRHELADLDPEEVRDMTDGLEADLTELVAERGAAALGSPVEYADELRAAAGLEVRSPGRPARRPVGVRVDGWLDAAHRRYASAVAVLPGDVGPLVAAFQPVWWVARAWLAVQLIDWTYHAMAGHGGHRQAVVPHMLGAGWAVLAVAVVLSVQLGRGRLWPGSRRTPSARVVLLGLNLLALAAVLVVASASWGRDGSADYVRGFNDGRSEAASSAPSYGIDQQAGLYSDGHWVSNIYAYDAAGKPLTGVQLFDQTGKPMSVVRGPECRDVTVDDQGDPLPQQSWSVVAGPATDGTCSDYTGLDAGGARVSYPWTNGAAQVGNVYPLATRLQESFLPQVDAFASSTPPTIGAFPMASVPPVSLPGITPSVQEAAPAKGAARGR